MFQVWSCGGGTQSCAIAALIVQGRLPKPDISVIADTGRETKTTWEYLDEVLRPAFATIGLEIHRISAAEWSYYHKTGHELFNSKGTLQIPAFSDITGQVSKFPAYCSSAWKQEPIDRWLRSKGVKKRQAVKWIGFSKNEQIRWVRTTRSKDFLAGLIRLPLVHDVPMTREDCLQVVNSLGWPFPPRSRCFDCPNQSDFEWLSLSPEEFALAVERDKFIRTKDPHAWLHRSCVPLDQVDFSQPEDKFSRPCDSGQCFV